ncbi:3-hydroxybutyryl-CoA dehydrogenase [Desulfoferula mesophila]|uniref:3-hydroxybutyryl-CoA dehydrogenase n=2 Tax=Desulfoferula mesophila TaxID=3058419 RepID=A0AAU9F5E6_9BACT|nr:3-hydroxybutyryl-CoA dehydrogenase [Desulfoferula mesophilus]
MGVDIAAGFAAGGWRVHLVEPVKEVAATAAQRLAVSLGELKSSVETEALALYADMKDIDWDRIDLVVEAVSENLALKQKIFAELERRAKPDIPLASNSSGIPISRIAQGLQTRRRMLGLHYFMPAHLVPLVEVVSSQDTDPAVARRVSEIAADIGKRPVWVKRDIPGFLANRIQHALMRETFALVEQGIASPEDVDASVRYGFGFRYVAAGPLLQKDLSGLDIQCAAAEGVYPDLCNDAQPSPCLKDKVLAGEIGVKSKKGFYDWDEESIRAEKTRYKSALMAALEILQKEGIK